MNTNTWTNDITFETIEIKRLVVEKYYQRKLSIAKVKKIVRQFNPHAVRVIRVSYRDGKLYVFDGQHTLMACSIVGLKYVRCEIHRGLTYEEEAELFAMQDENVIRVSQIDKHKALIQAKNEIHLEIEKIISKYGFSIGKHGGTRTNMIASVKTLEKVFKKVSLQSFENTLYVLRNAWDGSTASLNNQIIKGISEFLENNPEADINVLIKKLQKISPQKLKAEADTLKGMGGCESVIKGRYNLSLRSKAI